MSLLALYSVLLNRNVRPEEMADDVNRDAAIVLIDRLEERVELLERRFEDSL